MMERSVSANQIVDSLSVIKDGKRAGRHSVLNFAGDFSRIPISSNSNKIPKKLCRQFTKNSNALDEFRYQYLNFDVEPNEFLSDNKSVIYDFVTAKCRMLVYPDTDLRAANTCPDTSILWSNIAEVRYPQTEPTQCPICLLPPVAPRMGPCGHIYCWACIYHYIGYENDIKSKKCAVCNVFLRRNELNRVRISSVVIPASGSSCEFTLVRRRKDSMFPTPVNISTDSFPSFFPAEDSPVSIFSRIVVASPADMKALQQNDKECLEAYLVACQMDSEMDYIIPTVKEILLSLENDINCSKFIDDPSSLLSPYGEQSIVSQIYTYYEDVNGLDLYLHCVNWRCLTAEYEDQELPERITSNVLQVECYTMTPELRRRYRFLGHLPIGRSFYFVELDLRPPLVSIHTLFQFSSMLTARSLDREKRRQLERSLSRAKEEAENRLQSLSLGSRLSAPVNLNAVPTEDDFMPLPTTITKPSEDLRFRRSFATVSTCGASAFVDRHRIASFPVCPPGESSKRGLLFDPSSDAWPPLGATEPLPSNHAGTSGGSWTNSDYAPLSSSCSSDMMPAPSFSSKRNKTRRMKRPGATET